MAEERGLHGGLKFPKDHPMNNHESEFEAKMAAFYARPLPLHTSCQTRVLLSFKAT
jgi:hypothetical protein